MGWIMGPWMVVGTGALGGTLVLSEGAPDYPGPGRLWELVERHRISVLGVSPTLIRALQPHGDEPVAAHDRSSLRILGSTGEPWNPEPYRWLFEVGGEGRCPIINLSGGTEVGACFLSPMPVMPLKECTLGAPSLGMAMDVRRRRRRAGAAGRGRRAGLPQALAEHDPRRLGRSRALPATRTGRAGPGVWVHGDWASVDEDGYWYLHGRSDDTLNIAGKRIGPAEFESAAVAHPAVAEACAIGVPDEVKGEVAWLLLRPAARASSRPTTLRAEVRAEVTRELGKPFAPAEIRFVGGAAQDAQRQDRAPRRPGGGAGRGSGRPLVAGGPGRARAVCAVAAVPTRRASVCRVCDREKDGL